MTVCVSFDGVWEFLQQVDHCPGDLLREGFDRAVSCVVYTVHSTHIDQRRVLLGVLERVLNVLTA